MKKTGSGKKVALVTGAAGFIGYHVCQRLIDEGWRVVGLDCMSDYYDVSLKTHRESMLLHSKNYRSIHEKVEKPGLLLNIFAEEKPDIVIHLAAQAGVRYSIDNPRAYLESNIVGTFELLEAARAYPPSHMLLASTSSAYGASNSVPFKEIDKADHQISFYAATKKSTENMAHSYAHLFALPITMFRFFTVYGPLGRPDMAYFKFAKLIRLGEPIDIYNYGDMLRDFTYIDDIVGAIFLLSETLPNPQAVDRAAEDSISPVAPFRVVNIGCSEPVGLVELVRTLEIDLNKKAVKNYLPMQSGDTKVTHSDTELLYKLTAFRPTTKLSDGVLAFVKWLELYEPA